jgi:hypothetical protein
MTPTRHLTLAAALAAAVTLSACGGGGGIGGSGATTDGTMNLKLTDAPACGYDEVNVSIERVRVHASSTAVDADGGWYELALPAARKIDLLTLQNGVLDTLGAIRLPAGTYTQMRLVLAANGGATPLANSVVPTGGTETALTTPSGQQTGIKLNMNVSVPADQVVDAVIDFDACKSVVKRGNSGQYNLKPVISVTPVLSDAGLRITGFVDPLLAGANVSVQSNGVPLKATVPDAAGQFVLYPVPVGSHDLVLTAPGRVSAVLTGVTVVDTAHTVVSTAAAPILLPEVTVPDRSVAGTLSPATGTLRALQTLGNGSTVEIAWLPVDALSGAFAVALPVDAPLRAAFAPGFTFSPDTAAVGLYTLEASAGGVVKNTPVDTRVAVPPLAITVP